MGQSVVGNVFPEICARLEEGDPSAKYKLTLKFTLASQRSFLRKTNKNNDKRVIGIASLLLIRYANEMCKHCVFLED